MKRRASLGLVALFTALALVVTINLEFERIKVDAQRAQPVVFSKSSWRSVLQGLPQGIVESSSDLELKSLWQSSSSDSRIAVENTNQSYSTLLAMAVGISQKKNVDDTVRRFLLGNCSIMLFHYDGNTDGWRDLEWNDKALHIVARNQTKWYLHLMSSEGLEISQPALDPHRSVDIHHRITVRNRMTKVHRRVYDHRGSLKCSDESQGPPCTGWVEGMAPVFSRAAWKCVWHLIQNDLVHGWGLDMKLGYCAQGDRTKKVGVIDTEFIIHKGIPTLGGSSKVKNPRSLDLRTHIRRQSTSELETFKARWNKAVKEDREWEHRVRSLAKRKQMTQK